MTDKPRYKIISTPALVTIRWKDGTELKMSPQYAGKLALDIDLAALSAEKKGRKKCKVAAKYDYVPPRQLTPRPDMDEANDRLAAARSDEIRKGWDQRMQEAEAYNEERLGGRNALNAAIVAGYDPASGRDETVITVGNQRVRENKIQDLWPSAEALGMSEQDRNDKIADSRMGVSAPITPDMRKRIQDISGLGFKRDLTTVEIDLKKAETDAMERAVADECPLTD